MQIKFSKYHGTGNDFCIIDGRNLTHDVLSEKQIAFICHRRFGVGADGLIFLRNHDESDFFMDYFNSDGRRSTMCGNGGRCIVRYASDLGIVRGDCRFWAIDGLHQANITEDSISLKMNDVKAWDKIGEDIVLDTGSPHYVRFGQFTETFDVRSEGRLIRNSDPYAKSGINVNFVEHLDSADIKVATYERGVEDETYSCGTGVVASAIAMNIRTDSPNSVYQIKTKGGDLEVSFKRNPDSYTGIWLKGPAIKVFEGTINI